GNVGMPLRRFRAKAILKSLQESLGQRNFRQQDQHLPALLQSRGNRLEINLGLARAGDAVEQGDRKSPGLHCGSQATCGFGLIGRKRSEEHTSELQSRENLVCRLLLEKKKTKISTKRK